MKVNETRSLTSAVDDQRASQVLLFLTTYLTDMSYGVTK